MEDKNLTKVNTQRTHTKLATLHHILRHKLTRASLETEPVPVGAGAAGGFKHTVTAPPGTQGWLRDTFHSTFCLVFRRKVCFSPSHQQPLHTQLRVGAGAHLQLEQLPGLSIPQGQENSRVGQEPAPLPDPQAAGAQPALPGLIYHLP